MNVLFNKPFLKVSNNIKIEVLEAGLANLDSAWRREDVCSPYSRLYYVISGMGYLRLHDSSSQKKTLHALKPGFLYLIPNGLSYDYFCEDKLEKVYVHINVLLQNGLELFSGCKNYYALPVEEAALTCMKTWMTSDHPDDYFRLKGEIYHAVADFIQETHREHMVEQTYSPMVTSLFALLSQLKLSASIGEAARILNASESTLSKHFKKETGMSIGSYKEQLIMNQARQMLAMNQRSIGEIAEELGFKDQFYFAKYFKKRQGMPPSAYRNCYD